jgi:hypothetical protein
MERKGLLSAVLSLVVALGLAAVPATAKPRHHRHHATAISAEKGGDKGPSDNSGKGSDKGDDHGQGNGNAASQGNVDGNAQGNGNGQGNGKSDDSSDAGQGNDNSPGNGNSQGKGSADGTDDGPGNGNGNGNGNGSDTGNGQGNGNSGDAPGADIKPGKSTPDPTISADVPVGLIGAPDVPLASLPVELRPRVSTDVLVTPAAGQVLVSDGDGGFVPMEGAARVPVGAFVDANQGVITLVNRLPDGTTQTGSFAGAKFQVRQVADGTTTLTLRGSSFRDICGKVTAPAADGGPAGSDPTAGAARAKSKRVVRSLWASDHGGKYKTYGRNSVATVRGTVWQTVDRCDGTLVRVADGEVVVHDRRKHKDVVVTAGHSYLALDPGA